MVTSEEEILKRLHANYENVTALIPEKFRREFRNKIIRPKELGAYASIISKAIEFEVEPAKSTVKNLVRARLSIKGFNRKLMLAGLRSDQIYSEFFKGIFNND